jgi:glycosyltransferase involved in cell wall biosynthesis
MPTVAQRVAEARSIPFAIVPHGSAIEYVVKKDDRFRRLAEEAVGRSGLLLALGSEMNGRLRDLFAGTPDLDERIVKIPLGVDTGLFRMVAPRSRPKEIARLRVALRGARQGKGPELTAALYRQLDDSVSREELLRIQRDAAAYDAKNPDTDCGAKLGRGAWGKDTNLIFIGRLICGKGIHALVAAMPQVLEYLPTTRLLIVGHGPLRESLESMLWALQNGHRELFEKIATWAGELEGTRHSAPMIHVQHFVEELRQRGRLDAYFETARRARVAERVVFTGYLTHRELRHLLPCCDIALFPSLVPEAGPLVFLEAIASGVFPMGIDAAGIGASIDALSSVLPREAVDLMRLRCEPQHLVPDIVSHVPAAVALGRAHGVALRRIAVRDHDWKVVGRRVYELLRGPAS